MATGEVHTVVINVGALSNARRNLFKTPAAALGGGITLLEASVVQAGTTSSALRLVKTGSAGTAASGTITTSAVGGSGTAFAINTPKNWTIPASTAYVDANTWIAVKEANVQSTNAITLVSIKYQMGK